MNPLDPIVLSFVNKSFEIGEWLLSEHVISQDDLDECQAPILIGLPCLAILHCIEKTSNFDDGYVHLAVDRCIDPNNPVYDMRIRNLLNKILTGSTLYRTIPFSYNTYAAFKKSIIEKIKHDIYFQDEQNELFKILYDIALTITQINEYKDKFMNVINFLSILDT
ncbi:hypothetical protein QKU48_gp1042 [Fadolivirus algeromassiliense]|jgi:hypothetical protein|uniref:Uncharacterized protein n=1 Tax=Fadolivirus FV1/VV64 TaxID=3070911 RepID=A0A7D3QXH8_9VIRU|nr:hypothetical protein QKU48_gp1042 [Fadolivirus algeromassiliense]QKF94500.1 hypothetical protein Fadolivirus_1_1042 [Fadolivirus FV1/VV64]